MRSFILITCYLLSACGGDNPPPTDNGIRIQSGIEFCEKYPEHEFCNLEDIDIE